MLIRRHLFGLAAAGLAAPAVVQAQPAWPNRPVRLIAQYPPAVWWTPSAG